MKLVGWRKSGRVLKDNISSYEAWFSTTNGDITKIKLRTNHPRPGRYLVVIVPHYTRPELLKEIEFNRKSDALKFIIRYMKNKSRG